MKKLLYLIPAMLVTLTSCDGFFKLDSMEEPNAQITGKFIDKDTNETILLESYDVNRVVSWGSWTWTEKGPVSGYLQAYELGWDSEAVQNWYVKYDGTYTNNLVFAGKYRIDFSRLPVYSGLDEIEIKKGANTINFTKVPFARVKNFSMKFENGIFVADVDVEPGDASKTPNMAEVRLLVYTDRYVNSGNNRAADHAGAQAAGVWDWSTWSNVIAPGHKTLTIDPKANDPKLLEEFKYAASAHYFRVAAMCKPGENVNDIKNVSPIIKATPVLSGNTVTGYTFEEVKD